MTKGLSHITFICQDLDRMEEILTRVLNARKIYDSAGTEFSISPERFFDIGGIWVATMQGDPLPARSYNHVAFKIAESDYDTRLTAIRNLGLDLRESRPRVAGEGRSIYFHDADNHLFELHTGTLAERLARYAKGRAVG
ncbi:MAG TPA: FosX/FosE/FosI family fosfomycin resistance hydrolase [Paracoccus sp. (in: a-proteobacteria)]|uniref:FosX/FosE/FosI family fosfomycin resistance hydrolase n=1 Tax=uncultured Paracoccus sp. TaxID=189685 RepID=UPI002618772B|nr:FosX/FosE/FosI family fosfomycin resistance hydrolase [uncultured Paracoccus sp.]HMQ41394.1 FosX/FosE/FosI family fosfomycin resistance hydrolase [Paracoccus sp. (in: a-proteobacteria)]HMR37100.1 FosX/FosE/FosI family fosfomycin resistance hydrolase [Paracoccus sp. (in: a-proteobacteria)]